MQHKHKLIIHFLQSSVHETPTKVKKLQFTVLKDNIAQPANRYIRTKDEDPPKPIHAKLLNIIMTYYEGRARKTVTL